MIDVNAVKEALQLLKGVKDDKIKTVVAEIALVLETERITGQVEMMNTRLAALNANIETLNTHLVALIDLLAHGVFVKAHTTREGSL